MSWSKRYIRLLSLSSTLVLAGCGSDPFQTTIAERPLEFDAVFEQEYTTNADQSYVHIDDKERVGTMVVQSLSGSFTTQEMTDYMASSSYPGYDISKPSTETSDCDLPYTRYHAVFISDPVSEQVMYLSYVFLPQSVAEQTVTVSYLTTSKKLRKAWDKDRESYGCEPE